MYREGRGQAVPHRQICGAPPGVYMDATTVLLCNGRVRRTCMRAARDDTLPATPPVVNGLALPASKPQFWLGTCNYPSLLSSHAMGVNQTRHRHGKSPSKRHDQLSHNDLI